MELLLHTHKMKITHYSVVQKEEVTKYPIASIISGAAEQLLIVKRNMKDVGEVHVLVLHVHL